jgi:DNA-binding XRE family transcriptional regulator
VTPEEIRELRKTLSCTAKELAAALEIDQATVLAWEKGELFPTKQYVDRMKAFEAKGPSAIPRLAKGKANVVHPPQRPPEGASPMTAMREPAFWELVRKLAAHKKLRDEVTKLAAGYPDPD